ncbi:MAG: RluA family pseudouridine synthase [Lachnospiraceae bacterium]|nr:RluA family pseudouridine synthase [Lachnospiraceae bacterium]
MKIIIVNDSDAGQRFDKYLKKTFSEAGSGFIYKMLRKKNIVLNGKKSDGTDIIHAGDEIKVFFSDETFEKMKGKSAPTPKESDIKYPEIPIVFENEDLIFFNKPAGILSISDSKEGFCVNTYLLNLMSKKDSGNYKPSVANRLDRNTSGMILCAKTYIGARFLDECIKNHLMKKEYIAICHGIIEKGGMLKGYLHKDEKTNKVTVQEKPFDESEKSSYIETGYEPVDHNDKFTLFNVNLITGKSHQIRAHFASINHPLAGDIKYGGKKFGGINTQLLHAHKVTFPEKVETEDNLFDGRFEDVLGKTFIAEPPGYFKLT